MKYSLSEAARATGKNKTTIQRAIKNGKISAQKRGDGSYEIDPADLHAVFLPISAQPDAQQRDRNRKQQDKIPFRGTVLEHIAELERELAVTRERAIGLEVLKEQMLDTIRDLRKRLDIAESRVTALLVDGETKFVAANHDI